MDMHAAALPARSGLFTEADRAHPLFAEWRRYQNFCTAKMIDGTDFRDWLASREQQDRDDALAAHPRFREFQTWMRTYQKGAARVLPNGKPNAFPTNFEYWLTGGRW